MEALAVAGSIREWSGIASFILFFMWSGWRHRKNMLIVFGSITCILFFVAGALSLALTSATLGFSVLVSALVMAFATLGIAIRRLFHRENKGHTA
jgi:hypothetical protein